MIKKKKEGMKMTYKVTFHTIDGKAIVVDDVEAENQNEAWQEACEQDRESFIIYVASKETTYKVYKQHLVSIETKDKTVAARKTSETTMTAIDALSNMGF